MKLLICLFSLVCVFGTAQSKNSNKNIKKPAVKTAPVKDLLKINDKIPALIPQKSNGKFGFINQAGKVVIPHIYSNVGFFAEDCNLLHSPNVKIQKFGTNKYASVRLNGIDYRINEAGTRVYQFKNSDLGKCSPEFKRQLFHGYVMNNMYGVIEDSKFENPGDYRQFTIYPQYDYLHILEGDDLQNPMIIASKNNRFGVIDVRNNIIIPFEYSDIKRNFSWKLAKLFEVTKDGTHYYFVDENNKGY